MLINGRWPRIALLLLSARLQVAASDPPQEPTRSGDQAKRLASLELETLLNMEVTTASKFPQKLSDAPGVISVVSKDELQRFGGITLGEILERVPGLQRASAYFTDRSLVAARGDQTKIDGGHILILINGRPTREILEGGLISDVLESFPVSALERIEIIRGPGSVLYGSNAFSAVINLITQKAEGNSVAAAGLGGAEGTAAGSAAVTVKRGELGITAAGQFHQTPTWYVPYRSPFYPVQTAALPDRGTGMLLSANYKGLSVTSLFTDWYSASFVRGVTGFPKWKRGFGNLGYSFKPASRWTSSLDLTYTRNIFDVAEFPSIHRDSYEALLEWSNVVTVTGSDQLTFGALYSRSEGTELYEGVDPAIAISDSHRPGEAFYAQLEHSIRSRLHLIGGFQANKIGKLDLDVVPRFGVVWPVTSTVSVKALYSGAFRAPSLNETRINHPGLLGDPNLKPEKVATVDLGLIYQGNRGQAGLNYFYSKHTDNIIEDTSTPQWKYRNLGEATFHGAEFEGKYYLRNELLLLGSVLYQRNQDQAAVANVAPVPNWGVKSGISYDRENHWTLSLFNTYSGALDPRYNGVQNPTTGSYNLLSGNARADLSRHLGLSGRNGVALVIHATNLLNQKVWLPAWGDNSNDTMPVDRGRSVFVGLEFFLNRE